jgi:ligand-binding sensor domain-containing protein
LLLDEGCVLTGNEPGRLARVTTGGGSVERRLRRTAAIGVAVIAFAVAARPAPGLEADSSRPYGHDAWDSDSGLPQNSVQAITQTRDGYFWLGTQEGLVRFDGVRFTVFDGRNTPALQDDWIQAVCTTRDGSLWIGTVVGLVRYTGGRFEAWGIGTPIERAVVSSLLESRDGSLWIGSSVGLGRIRNGRLEILSERADFPKGRVRALHEDSSGSLWFGLPDALARLRDGRVERRTLASGFPGPPLAIVGDGDGGVWVGTGRSLVRVHDDRVTRYGDSGALADATAEALFRESGTAGLSNSVVQALLRDADGNVWVGTPSGLFRFRAGKFTRYTTENGLSSNRILSLYEDREGSIWIGTLDGGLNRFKGQRVFNYTHRDGLSDDKVWTVFQDREGSLWVGAADGDLDRMVSGAQRFEHFANFGNTIMAIEQDARGDLWLGTQGAGLIRLHNGRPTRFTTADGLPGNWITSVCAEPNGALWIGTVSGGAARFENGRFRAFHVRDGLPSEQIFSIFRDREGDVWVGTFGGGVARYRRGAFQTFTTRDGLAHDVVISIFQDSEGAHWFATRGGLTRWRDGKFSTYRESEGLFHDAVQRVLEDGYGYLWLTSSWGIFRVRQSELAAVADGVGRLHPVAFNTASGMRGAECNNAQHGAWKSRDGRLWFATVKGLAMADPSCIRLNTTPPAVVVEDVLANGETLPRHDGRLELPPGRGDLEFRYTAFNYSNPTAVRFRYRLDGIDSRWVEAGTRRSAYYPHLPPGGYRFRVKACNEDGVWNERGATVPLELAPRFYQTPWARGLALLSVCLVGFAVHRLRVRRIESREWFRTALTEAKLSALQAQLRPHFLSNTLNSILALIGTDPTRARRMTERLGDLLRASLETEPGGVVTLERELSILELYVGIEKMRFRDRLEFAMQVEPAVRCADVPSFLLQPLVENAVKHGMRGRAAGGVVRIAGFAEGTRLILRVEDNGPGVPPETAVHRPGGIGVRNTRQRLETLYSGRHRFEMTNSSAGGCLVTIEIPLTFEASAAAPQPAAGSGTGADTAAPGSPFPVLAPEEDASGASPERIGRLSDG